MHGGGVLVNGIDEAIVDRQGNLGRGKGCLKRGAVVAGIGKERQLLHLRPQDGSARVLDLVIGSVHAVIGALAQGTILVLQQHAIAAMRHMVRLALGVDGIGEGEVGIVEHGEHLAGTGGHLLSLGQQGLLGRRQHVVTQGTDLVEGATVLCKCGKLLIPALKRRVIKRHQGGLEPCGSRRGTRGQGHHLALEILEPTYGMVLVGTTKHILAYAIQGKLGLVIKAQIPQEFLGAMERLGFPGGVGLGQALGVRDGLDTVLHASKDGGNVPRVPLGDVLPMLIGGKIALFHEPSFLMVDRGE